MTDRLWAPWRLAYIKTAPAPPSGCFLCRGVAENNDRDNLFVRRTLHSVLLLNRFPYNNGHLMVAPLRHLAGLDDLSSEELLDGLELLRSAVRQLQTIMTPHGFNIGLNLGQAAGAGVPGHLHWHIVPRWNGDANFLAVTADTRVIVQSLEALYDLLLTTPDPG
jgi:ATP adenylyltransferase